MELFIMGSVIFWALLLIEFIFLIWATEWEKWGYALTSVLILIGVVSIFSDVNLLQIAWDNPWQTVLGIIAYFVPIGISVGGLKWFFFITDARDKNREVKTDWLKNAKQHASDITQNLQMMKSRSYQRSKENQKEDENLERNIKETEIRLEAFTAAISSGSVMTEDIWPYWKQYESVYTWHDMYGRRRGITRPKAKDHKARIASWIAWWPAVGFWTLLHDPIKRIGIFLYNLFAKLLERISLFIWRNEDEFPGGNDET